jgi:hypothetical protein
MLRKVLVEHEMIKLDTRLNALSKGLTYDHTRTLPLIALLDCERSPLLTLTTSRLVVYGTGDVAPSGSYNGSYRLRLSLKQYYENDRHSPMTMQPRSDVTRDLSIP